MKKKTMAFGGLLMAVAMTGYSVSGTYAKYISSIDITDEARVAKWNFNTDQELDLFASSYSLSDANGEYTYVQSLVQKKNADGTPMFEADGTTPIYDDVVAPGTHGIATVEFSGKTETNYKLSFDVEEIKNTVKVAIDDTLNTTGREYAPVMFTLSYGYIDEVTGNVSTPIRETVSSKIGAHHSLEEGIEAINNKLATKVFAPSNNENAKHFLTISWSWAFDAYDVVRMMQADSSNGYESWSYTKEYIDANFADDLDYAKTLVNDELDTLLGTRATKGQDLSIKLNIKAVVEQTKEKATNN